MEGTQNAKMAKTLICHGTINCHLPPDSVPDECLLQIVQAADIQDIVLLGR